MRQFYRTQAWREVRQAYYISQHGICERCGNAGLIVHHKIELTPENIGNPDITLNWDNLELLCQACHNAEHFGGGVTADGLTFDAEGNLTRKWPTT